MKWKIGDVEILNQVVVGPMAGISNSAFREIAHSFNAGLIYTEMVSDKAIYYSNKKTIDMTRMGDDEGLVAMQLFGHDVESLVVAAKYLDENTNCAIIDINVGCPAPKIVNSGSGSALMKNPELLYTLVKAVVDNVKKPVTCKIRAGWDEKSINAVEIAKLLEKAGAKAIAVHGRVRSQYYQGKADWQIIKEVKANVSIPVIGNGDVTSVELAKQMLLETNCDAIMLARGVLGNPWLIKECVDALSDNSVYQPITIQEKFTMARQHALKLIEIKNEKVAILEMRSHACWYIYGLPNNHKIKDLINQMTTYQQFDTILKEYQALLENQED